MSGRRRILAPTKDRLTAPALALACHLEATAAGAGVARLVGDVPTAHTAAGLLTASGSDDDRPGREEAEDFLCDALDAGPMPAKEILAAARQAGISKPTLRRAKAGLGVAAHKYGMAGRWAWGLPPKVITQPEDDQPRGVIIFNDPDHLRGVRELVDRPAFRCATCGGSAGWLRVDRAY